MKTKFAIGCLVQWYECDIIESYVDSLKDAMNCYHDGQVIVDFTIVSNEDLEKCISSEQKEECMKKIVKVCNFGNVRFTDDLHTIADYRRLFNADYCDEVDVLIWGESDAILPKQMFGILDNLHQMSLQNNNQKYLAFFGTCKMWDDSWKVLEHPKFTDKLHSDDKNDWWSVNYTMTKDEMNEINNETDELDVQILPQHKFNGCGLVISSEVIRSGVNIPKSVFFVHEDSAFMWMTNKILGNIPQYVIKNILLVHNRKSLNKRAHIKGEVGKSIGQLRNSNEWYNVANKMCEKNYQNLFNPQYKSYNWEDVWNNIK